MSEFTSCEIARKERFLLSAKGQRKRFFFKLLFSSFDFKIYSFITSFSSTEHLRTVLGDLKSHWSRKLKSNQNYRSVEVNSDKRLSASSVMIEGIMSRSVKSSDPSVHAPLRHPIKTFVKSNLVLKKAE